MNEVGVDPGIDHMLAMECFDGVKASGGKVNNLSANTKIKDGEQRKYIYYSTLHTKIKK